MESLLSQAAFETCNAIRHAVISLPLPSRASRARSVLKPPPGTAALPDIVGEEAAWEVLQQVSNCIGSEIRVIIDLDSYHSIMPEAAGDPGVRDEHDIPNAIWCYLDAVDGTIKVAGLNNEAGRLRAANDGSWAVGVAFTMPTKTTLMDLRYSDFKVAAIVNGGTSSSLATTFPRSALATFGDDSGVYETFEGGKQCTRLHTTTNPSLSQSFAFLDSFQAFDRNSHQAGDEELACALYARLMNRNEGGAFDVLRSYGNLAAILQNMLGWQGDGKKDAITEGREKDAEGAAVGTSDPPLWLESQCGAFIVVNENLHNLIPALPIIIGAGGIATDFDGQPLLHRKLAQGRCNVVYAANIHIHSQCMALIERAQALSSKRATVNP